jgi:hypothetical protein
VREDELKQAIECCREAESRGLVGVILGDLNCGPEASSSNFHYCLNAGYRDTYLEAVESKCLEDGPIFTWDPVNMLNAIGESAYLCE